MNILLIKDETATGKIIQEFEIQVAEELTTVKEIIIARVEAEVKNYNKRLPEYFRGLIRPAQSEQVLNGYKMKTPKQIDIEKQTYIALDAFQKNAYFILIGNLQAESLQQEILVENLLEVAKY